MFPALHWLSVEQDVKQEVVPLHRNGAHETAGAGVQVRLPGAPRMRTPQPRFQADGVRDADPKGAQPPVARADQTTVPTQSCLAEPARLAPRTELAFARLECLLSPCMGSQAGFLLA
jgi:hypothetical protein